MEYVCKLTFASSEMLFGSKVRTPEVVGENATVTHSLGGNPLFVGVFSLCLIRWYQAHIRGACEKLRGVVRLPR